MNEDHPAVNFNWKRKRGIVSRAFLEVVDDLDLQLMHAASAVVAYQAGKIVGLFRYTLYKKRLTAYGTCVHPKLRKRGVATRLWTLALRKTAPKSVRVFTASREGVRLVTSLSKLFNRIHWDIS
jgi:predicted GNAT family acetyltransferase